MARFETRFITPSFPSNSIGMLDLNSIAVGVSPAYNMRIEHPTGSDYALHLQDLAELFELPIRENAEVLQITKEDDVFSVETAEWTISSKNVIWAAGEFLYPRLDGFSGSELCLHTSTLENYAGLEGNEYIPNNWRLRKRCRCCLPLIQTRQEGDNVRQGRPLGPGYLDPSV